MDNERGQLGDRLQGFGEEPEKWIWDTLEAQLAAKRKKRPLGFFWLLAGLLLISGGIGWSLYPSFKNSFEQKKLPIVKTKNTSNQKQTAILKNSKPNHKSTSRKTNLNSNPKFNPRFESKVKPELKFGNKPKVENIATTTYSKSATTKKLVSTSNHKRKKTTLLVASESNYQVNGFNKPESEKRNPVFRNIENQKIEDEQSNDLTSLKSKSDTEKTTIEENKITLLANSDSIEKQIKKTESILSSPVDKVLIANDSSVKKSGSSWQLECFVSSFYTAHRSWQANQGKDTRIALGNQKAGFSARHAFEIGGLVSRKLNSILDLTMTLGIGNIVDEAQFETKKEITNFLQTSTSNQELIQITPVYRVENKIARNSRIYALLSTGLKVKPFGESAYLAFSGGIHYSLSEKRSNNAPGKNDKTVAFIQLSTGISKRKGSIDWIIEPQIRLFGKPTFTYQNETSHKPLLLGVKIGAGF